MPWYKSGTVSVTQNSNAVFGNGTAFFSNSRVGDAFRGPDGGWYEVTNILSDTSLSISPTYRGATTTGSYAVAPMQGYVKDSADALRSMVNQYGAKLSALGTTGNYDILPLSKGGTGVAVSTNADLLANIGAMPTGGGAYSPAFNSLRVVNGAIPSSQGGHVGWNETNGSNMSGAVSFTCNQGGGTGGFSWRTVNQTNTAGGPFMTYSYAGVLNVPAGLQLGGVDVVASGNNANGAFIKYADGSLICWQQLATDAITTVAGSIFVTSPYNSAFPSAFIAIPRVLHSGIVATGSQSAIWSVSLSPPTINNFGNYRIASAVSLPGVGAFINVLAMGRWK
jgi:hypothetical protein